MKNLQFHEAANLFPLLEGKELDDFIADIKENGCLEPVELFEGKILDGRNRYRACESLGAECPSVAWSGDNPIAYVISKNLHRRHLTTSQKAMIGDKARELFDERAKERQADSARRNQPQSLKVVTLPPSEKSKARDEAGKAVGVSGSLMDHARNVRKRGEPEIVKAVEEGRLAVTKASKIVDESPEVQRRIAAAPEKKNVVGWKTKSITRARLEKLDAAVKEVSRLLARPALQVSIRDVKNGVKEVSEMVSELLS